MRSEDTNFWKTFCCFTIIVIRIVRRSIEDIAASSSFCERHYNEHRQFPNILIYAGSQVSQFAKIAYSSKRQSTIINTSTSHKCFHISHLFLLPHSCSLLPSVPPAHLCSLLPSVLFDPHSMLSLLPSVHFDFHATRGEKLATRGEKLATSYQTSLWMGSRPRFSHA